MRAANAASKAPREMCLKFSVSASQRLDRRYARFVRARAFRAERERVVFALETHTHWHWLLLPTVQIFTALYWFTRTVLVHNMYTHKNMCWQAHTKQRLAVYAALLVNMCTSP